MTTTALALTAAWPVEADGGVRPVMVEADGSGGDLMIRFGLPTAPSLLDVAATAGQLYPGSLLGAASELPCGVRTVVAVPGRGPCGQAVRLLAGEAGLRVLRGEADERGTVLLDLGRLGEDIQPFMDAADQVVLVTRGGAEPLTHVSAYGLDADRHAGRLTLAVVGPSPYPAEEIATSLGIRHVAFLPWDARTVAALNSLKPGALRGAGFRRPPLIAAVRALACRLAEPQGTDAQMGAVEAGHLAGSPGAQLAGQRHSGLVQAPGYGGGGS
ncbi:hypothetical protein [Streptomyces sp. MNU89]|uniref:MinD/ParA family ATP-binding protein n=1 Tax=Streptomyces sp. MNU89 TaxID=2560025 RepID=UPI001E5CBC25|nr:hypothetical protein [Streptomyces sp. MNU89]MCC9738530.1 hypothetical protein [Streptomyces sp. MNU89]